PLPFSGWGIRTRKAFLASGLRLPPLPRPALSFPPAPGRALPPRAWLPQFSPSVSPAAPAPPAVPPRSALAHSRHLRLRLLSPPAPTAFLPPPLTASPPLASARNSSPCACSHGLGPCCHPTPLAPASSSPPATRSAAFDPTALAVPANAASENPRSLGNRVHSLPPASGSPHLPPISSASGARKIPLRSSHRAESCLSSADGREAVLALLSHRQIRSRSNPADRPHPRQNALNDSPATNRAGSAVIVDLAPADKPGKLGPYRQTGISFL